MNKIVKFLTLFLCFALLLNNAVFAQTLIYDEADEISAKEQLLNQNDNRIIVKYKENTEIVRLAKSDMKAKNKEYQIVNTLNDEKIQVLEVTNGNMNDVLCELSDNDNVEYAQPDYKVQISSDNFSEKLWAIQNNGQTIDGSTGVEGFDIGILQAWNSTKGNEETIIGVIDTGIDINHTALCDNIWTNEREIADNNIDDDGNGFVDDVNGWDFVNNDNTVYDSTVFDEHGTHVAGIIAGKNTEKSFSGVAPNVKIMPLKALNYNSGYTSDILAAIEYASSVGIKILNCSFSGLDYNEALADAISSHPNILFVCAAGNYGKNTNELITFPACYDASNILSVAAVNNKGVIAPFSTYGEEIDVAAPGMNIYSTLPNNEYGFKDGTSSAAAYASGIAALICDVDKTTNPIQLKEKIIQSCNKEVVAYDETLGVVDANEALDEHVKLYSNITEDDVKKDNGLPFIFDKNDQGTVKLTIYTIGYETASLSVSNYLQEESSELVYQNNSILNGEQEIQGLSSEIEYNFTLKISDEDITSSYSGCLLIDSAGNCNLYNIISNVYIIPQNNGDMQLMSDGTKWELESNNVYELADIIYDDYDVYGYISSTSDVDYFKVKFSSSGSANFWLGNIQNNCNYNMQIRDANDEYIAGSFNAMGNDESVMNYNVEANVWYYIRINSAENTYNTSSPYLLRVKWYPRKDSCEDNNTIGNAHPLGNSYANLLANINSPYDIDYYNFTVSGASKMVNVRLSSIPYDSDYDLRILNSAGSEVVYSNNSNNDNEDIIVNLSSGTYYIEVKAYGDDYSAENYELLLAISSYSTITLDESYYKSNNSNNYNFFKFTIDEYTGVKTIVDDCGNDDYDIYLYQYQSAKGRYKLIDYSERGGSSDYLGKGLSAGTYCIKVYKYRGTENSFAITTETSTTQRAATLEVLSYPTALEANETGTVRIKVTNNGYQPWTKTSGYSLALVEGDTSIFPEVVNLSSSEVIEYGEYKIFSFNVTAPVTSTSQSYESKWRMSLNSTPFGGNARFTIEFIADIANLTLGSSKTISGTPVKWYKFVVSTNGNYAIRTLKSGTTSYDTVLELYDSNFNILKQNDDVKNGSEYSRIETHLLAGTYYLKARAYNDGALYCKVFAESFNYTNISTGTSVIINNLYEGYYRFTVTTAGDYVISTSKYSQNRDTYLIIYDDEYAAEARRVAYNDISTSDYAEISDYFEPGTYYIRVTTYDYLKKGDDKKNICKLKLTKTSSTPSSEERASISIISPLNGVVLKTYDGASIKITGTASNVSSVNVVVNGQPITNVKVYNGKYEAYYTPKESDEYSITVTGNAKYGGDNPTAQRTVTIIVNDDSDVFENATSIKAGTHRLSAIDVEGDLDCYRITPSRDGNYRVYTSGETDTLIDLFNSEYNLISSSDDDVSGINGNNADISVCLYKNRTYYVRVQHAYEDGVGQYVLGYEFTDDDNEEDIPLVHNQKQRGYIDYQRDEDVYVFIPTTTDEYTFSTTGNNDMFAILCDSNGLISFDRDSGIGDNCSITETLISGQEYYFIVQSEIPELSRLSYFVIVE